MEKLLQFYKYPLLWQEVTTGISHVSKIELNGFISYLYCIWGEMVLYSKGCFHLQSSLLDCPIPFTDTAWRPWLAKWNGKENESWEGHESQKLTYFTQHISLFCFFHCLVSKIYYTETQEE